MNSKTKNWLLVFIWAGIIFFFSHQPELKSGLPNEWDFLLRKSAHITEYAVLCFLLIRALSQYALTRKKVLILSVIIALFYAFSDEFHQTLIFGREGCLRDVGIDGLGVFLSAWLFSKKVIE